MLSMLGLRHNKAPPGQQVSCRHVLGMQMQGQSALRNIETSGGVA